MRTPALALLLLGLAGAAGAVEPKGAPSADLPDGIAPQVQQRSECFLPGEKAQYRAAIDATRISVPGCANGIIPPQRIVQSYRVYKQRNNHVVDCAGTRRNDFNTGYLDLFLKELVDQVDSRDGAQCAANMLYNWASAAAMTEIGAGGTPNQSRADMMWTLAGLSAAYFKSSATQARAQSITDPSAGSADAAIRHWFTRLSGSVAAEIGPTRARDKENNIQYWRGWSILPTAMLTEDPALLRASQGVFGRAMQVVTAGSPDPSDSGFLPLELKRYDKALRYQTFAAEPLVAMATVSQAYGCSFLDTSFRRQQLVSLMVRTIEGSEDPQIVSVQQLRRGITRHPVPQLPTHQSLALVDLIDRIDPALKDQIDSALAALHATPPDGWPDNPARDRLGGSFRTLADASLALRDSKSPRLAEACGAPG